MIHNVLILIHSMLYDPVYSILSFILYTMLYNNAPCYIWILDGSYMDSTWIIYECIDSILDTILDSIISSIVDSIPDSILDSVLDSILDYLY